MKNRSITFRLVTFTLIISALAAIAALGATSPAVKAFDSVKEYFGMAPTSQTATTAPNQRLNAVANGSMFTQPMQPMMPTSFTGTSYTQNFNTLATSGTANSWTNDSTLAGWFLYDKNAAAITTYGAETGSTGLNTFTSYGTTSERALGAAGSGGTYFGSPAGGAIAGWIAFSATNNTGSTVNNVKIAFDGEQWRNVGNATAQTMVLEYGIGSTFAGVSTWTAPGGNFGDRY
jgi:hypothetical protein